MLIIVISSYFATRNYEILCKQLFRIEIILIALFVGCSDMLGGYDRYIYGEAFDSISSSIHNGIDIRSLSLQAFLWLNEPAYFIWNILIGFITQNRYIFIFITTLLIYWLIYKSFIANTSNPLFALILFLGLYFFFTFTYLRQVIAVAILWNSLAFIEKRQLIRFLSTVLLAAMFHNSAIIFAIMYFIPIRKYNILLVFLCFISALFIGVTGVHSKLFNLFGSLINNEARTATYENIKEIRIEYIIESLLFLFLIFFSYKRIGTDKRQIILLNCSLMFCMVLAFFCTSSDGGRISWYFMIGLIALFSQLYAPGKAVTASGLTLILMSILLYMRILIVWGVLIYPYKTFFTNGIREGDYIHSENEYDHRYNYDKFYK